MVYTSNHATLNMYPWLENVMQVKIDEFNKVKGDFIAEIRKREEGKLSVNILPRVIVLATFY